MGGGYAFKNGWIFTDLFFIFTGYFTFSHFVINNKISDDENNNKIELYCRRAFGYTFKKILPFISLIFTTIIFSTLVNFIANASFDIGKFVNSFVEIFLFSRGDWNNPPLWYIQAMFVVMPLFCLIIQCFPITFNYLWSLLLFILYFDAFGGTAACKFPLHYVRAFAGMSSGIIVFGVSQYLSHFPFKIIYKMIGNVLLLFCVFMCYFKMLNSKQFIFIFFVASCLLFSSDLPFNAVLERVSIFIRRLSINIYLLHYSVIVGINFFVSIGVLDYEIQDKFVPYVLVVIVISFTFTLCEQFFVVNK